MKAGSTAYRKFLSTGVIPRLLALAFGLIGCEEDHRSEGFETIVLSGEICPDCAHITVRYPQLLEESPLQQSMDRSIREEIIEALTLQESGLASTVEEAIASFDDQNRKMNRRFSDEQVKWVADIEGTVLHKSSKLIGLHMAFNINTGGAHGNDYHHLLTFDVQRGREIDIDEVLFINEDFVSTAEKYFRSDQDLDASDSLVEAGFIFLGNRFVLPETIGLGSRGVILFYQQGEISSAMDGPVTAIIPYSEASRFLKDSYRGAF